jgi:predicted Zn-dependent peptidase
MRDRQTFLAHQLKNGIRVYHYPSDEPYAVLRLRIPFGSAHDTGEVLPGSAHFFEHMVMQRSLVRPERGDLVRLIGDDAGDVNAFTGVSDTIFVLEAEAGSPWFASLAHHVFSPLFVEEDISLERRAVVNERQQAVWHPCDDELNQYLFTQWMTGTLSLRQAFGDDEDLEAFTPEYLYRVHECYMDPEVVAVVAGGHSVRDVCEVLEGIPTKKRHERVGAVLRWARPEYHEHQFANLGAYELFLGGLLPSETPIEDQVAVAVLLDYFTASYVGLLYAWLREETGWACFTADAAMGGPMDNILWRLHIPLNEKRCVSAVRSELWDRVQRALSDEAAVGREVRRQILSNCVSEHTLSDIADHAIRSLSRSGRIITETERGTHMDRCRDTRYLLGIFDRYFLSAQVGEVCAMPE